MAILDLFTAAVKELKTFEKHPLQNATLEEQISYLNMLSLMANVDGDIHANEVHYIECLAKCFSLDRSIIDGVFLFSKDPDKESIQDFILNNKKRFFAEVFIFDALVIMNCDGEAKPKEIDLLKQMNLGLSLPISKQKVIKNIHDLLLEGDVIKLSKLLNFQFVDKQGFEHVAKYYDVKIKFPKKSNAK